MQKKIIVACSGGPDSMALLDKLYKQGHTIIVAHVNYHKRDTANRDEKIVRDYCQERSIEVEVQEPTFDNKSNFQSWARKVRYDFFFELAAKNDTDQIYVAHHLDDHLETYLFQKSRNMLCDHYGLKSENIMKGMKIIRPLLHETKAQLIEYCDQNNIEYGIDESNLGNDYTRNKIRHSQIEKMSLLEKLRLNEEIQKENIKLKDKREKAASFLKGWDRSIDTLLKQEDAWFILEYYLHLEIGNHYSKKHMKSLIEQLQSNCLLEFDGYYLESYEGMLYFKKIKENKSHTVSYLEYITDDSFSLLKTGKVIESIYVSEKDFPLVIRSVKPGDQIKLRYGTKKVSRFLIDRKIPKIYRKEWLVMENSAKKVIFVPGIGCDVEHFSIKPNLFMVQYLT